ncbi:unnamed protein product [Sphagnum troendelagicum]|uniref:Uncharacterized protein n=1 Tax=Sphagnum troendelagicum TaxID=128251 RepID=A0ABP0TP05_9BRYO
MFRCCSKEIVYVSVVTKLAANFESRAGDVPNLPGIFSSRLSQSTGRKEGGGKSTVRQCCRRFRSSLQSNSGQAMCRRNVYPTALVCGSNR